MLFSQREGLKPVKGIIQIDSMDDDLRYSLWNIVSTFCWVTGNDDTSNRLSNSDNLNGFYRKLCEGFYKEPIPPSKSSYTYIIPLIQDSFRQYAWYEVYDFLEFTASNYPHLDQNEFMNQCNSILERELSAYRFVGGKITQITSEAEISAIEDALLNTQPLKPVHIHLRTALDFLSDRKLPDYRNSIKESISAVEAMCSLIKGSKATLGQAIKAVESKVGLHPALKGAFNSLYGYTNDASGIRHALMDEPNLDFEDAKFMLVSCSTFINYLISKATKAGITFLNLA